MRARLAGLFAVAAVGLLGASLAWACTGEGTISSLSAASGPAGSQVTVNGTSFAHSTTVLIRWGANDGPILAQPAPPSFAATVTVPDVAPGLYMIFAQGWSGATKLAEASKQFEVLAPAAPVNPPPASPTTTVASNPNPVQTGNPASPIVVGVVPRGTQTPGSAGGSASSTFSNSASTADPAPVSTTSSGGAHQQVATPSPLGAATPSPSLSVPGSTVAPPAGAGTVAAETAAATGTDPLPASVLASIPLSQVPSLSTVSPADLWAPSVGRAATTPAAAPGAAPATATATAKALPAQAGGPSLDVGLIPHSSGSPLGMRVGLGIVLAAATTIVGTSSVLFVRRRALIRI